jgi:hypothetical protein
MSIKLIMWPPCMTPSVFAWAGITRIDRTQGSAAGVGHSVMGADRARDHHLLHLRGPLADLQDPADG